MENRMIFMLQSKTSTIPQRIGAANIKHFTDELSEKESLDFARVQIEILDLAKKESNNLAELLKFEESEKLFWKTELESTALIDELMNSDKVLTTKQSANSVEIENLKDLSEQQQNQIAQLFDELAMQQLELRLLQKSEILKQAASKELEKRLLDELSKLKTENQVIIRQNQEMTLKKEVKKMLIISLVSLMVVHQENKSWHACIIKRTICWGILSKCCNFVVLISLFF